MSDPYRTMCADMLEAFDGLPCETNYRGQSRPIVCSDEEPFDRARALLAQPEPEGLSDEEIESEFRAWWNERYGSAYFGAVPLVSVIEWTQHVTARRPTPQPPADGEVGYALLELRSLVMGLGYAGMYVDAQRLERAADLLERQHPQPVAVSERPWEREGWCDDEGRCWLRRRYEKDGVTWRLMAPASLFDDVMPIYYAEALPFNALPAPRGPQ
jgi:hypothetical protein